MKKILQNKKSFNDLLTPKNLRKKNLIIMGVNIGIFATLCLAVFIIIIVPILQWMYTNNTTPLTEYLLKVWFIGIPILAFTILYGAILFWPLLLKFNHIRYNDHDLDIYLGVKTIVICLDGKVVGYATHGFFSCPIITWYIQIGDEYTTIKITKKNQYDIDLNSEPINFHKVEFESKNDVKVIKTK